MQSLETKSSRPRPRRDLKHSRPRLQKTGLQTRLETETKSGDSITAYLHIIPYSLDNLIAMQQCQVRT